MDIQYMFQTWGKVFLYLYSTVCNYIFRSTWLYFVHEGPNKCLYFSTFTNTCTCRQYLYMYVIISFLGVNNIITDKRESIIVRHNYLHVQPMSLWLSLSLSLSQVFLPKSNITNFSTDWNNGIILSALVNNSNSWSCFSRS